jgi:hypothetical protein
MPNTLTKEQFFNAAEKLPKVACGATFSVDVSNQIHVQQCGHLSPDETQRMFDGLIYDWQTKATIICAQNGKKCPRPAYDNFTQTSSTCDANNIWTVTARVEGKCKAISAAKKGGSVKKKRR